IGQLVEITRATRADWPRLVVVVSAMNKVTDLLLAGAQAAAAGDEARPAQIAGELRARHAAVLDELVGSPALRSEAGLMVEARVLEFGRLCQAVAVLGEASPRALDAISGLGERLSVPLVAAALSGAGVPARAVEATRVIVTDGLHQSASPDMEA